MQESERVEIAYVRQREGLLLEYMMSKAHRNKS